MSGGDGAVMSFREHLLELRTRLVRTVAVLVVGFLVCWEFRIEIFDFLSRPIAGALADNGIYHFQAIQITESVFVYIKVAFVGALVLTSPFIFWQLWGFVAPGLYSNEKRFILPLTAFSVVFFFIGSSFSYAVLLPFITDWMVSLTHEAGNVEMLVTLQNAYSFAFTFLLMFGLVFELPLVIFFLALWGNATGKGLLKFWRYFVVLSFLISAILTPPDPLSQGLMALPLNLLYGFGVLVAFAVSRARDKHADRVGGRALQAMAMLLAGVVAVGVAVVLFFASLPDRTLLAAVPERATWALGVNPKALYGDDQLRRVLTADPALRVGVAALAEHGVAVDEVTEGLALSDGARLAVLLRGAGLGAAAMPLHEALDAGREGLRHDDWVAAAVDDETLLVGHRNLVVDVLAAADEEAPAAPQDEEDGRLLKRLAESGPAWAWVPSGSARSVALLGNDVAVNVANAGAVLSLGERQRLSLHARAKSEGRVDVLDAQLEAARNAALAVETDTRQAGLVRALERLADEVARLAPAADRPRVLALREEVGALVRGDAASSVPAIARLAPLSRGWAVRQNDTWFMLTTELAEDGAPALIELVTDLVRQER